jgi:hypothetical protein
LEEKLIQTDKMKQTAVDFAVEQLEKLIPSGNQIIIRIILEKAKAMHKEEIENAYIEGCGDNILCESTDKKRAEEYYNETFKP